MHVLPPTLSALQAAHLLGTSPSNIYRAAKRGNLPVSSMKVNATLRVSTSQLLEQAGINKDDALEALNEMEFSDAHSA
ncbi:helix-turn-helix domain-containing protein [Corynebacterium pseudodiphtheriticum]|nr:helix-turn-helix domain-containing protein [Corynebacterium pseudodiphtheriticum]